MHKCFYLGLLINSPKRKRWERPAWPSLPSSLTLARAGLFFTSPCSSASSNRVLNIILKLKMVITRLQTQESSQRAGDASDSMCCILELVLLLSGLDLPIRFLLMDVTWWQSGLFTCLESSMLVIQRPLIPSCPWLEEEAGSPRLAYPDGTAAGWKMGLLGYQKKTEGSHG